MGKVTCKGCWEHLQALICVCPRKNPKAIYAWPVVGGFHHPAPPQALLAPVRLQRANPFSRG